MSEVYAAGVRPALLRLALAMTGGDGGLAEDVVQEVLIRVHQRWDSIAVLASRDAYVKRMVVNEYLSWRRKWARLVPTATVLPPLDDAPDHPTAHADRDLLVTEIRRLPARQRAAITLRFYEDWPDDQIADALGCAVVTVRSLVSRGLARLRVQLDVDTPTHTDAPATHDACVTTPDHPAGGTV